VPIILEGVHAHPEISMNLPDDTDAIAVHTTLAVLKSKELKRRLRGRGAEVPARRAKRYLNTFDSIWSLQTFLLSESDRCDVPIITNADKEKTIHQVILQVNYELSRHFTGSPRDVFGEVVDRAEDLPEEAEWHERLPALLGQ
jgi:2-phosphoglycerate kinase